jgi:hypothetical protein
MQDGLRRSNFDITNLDATNTSGTNLNVTSGTMANGAVLNDLTIGSSIYVSSTNAEGIVLNSLKAEAIISGGMWVCGSAASGATISPIAKPEAGAQALGIALATTGSNSVVPILTRGRYDGLIAEASVSAGAGFAVGAGAKINCVKATGAGVNRGTVLMGAGSEGVVSVYLF